MNEEIQAQMTLIAGTNFEALQKMGVSDNCGMLLGIPPEDVLALLLGLKGFREYKRQYDESLDSCYREVTFTDDDGWCALVEINRYTRMGPEWPTRMRFHPDYHDEGRAPDSSWRWLHPIRDAVVTIASAAKAKNITLRWRPNVM